MTEKGAVDIRALARLARVEIADSEVESLEKELPNILSFVESIQNITVAGETKGLGLHNVLRDDTNPIEGGLFSERLLNAAPVRDGDRIAVQQVISRKSPQGGSTGK
ncbi:MAG: aspartyl/glutamyl-tRNA amidotransferase subunit C [Candidatus Pacebacteria bacterium]|nr:aspartyl/glutamyl-tRNA amidotransferase subunit C [Candidatus Paceibacterota bacterium]